MSNILRSIDWHTLVDQEGAPPVASSRGRLRWVLALFAAAAAIVFGRATQLEISDGANFRQLAAQPIERNVALRGERGRILARDGAVLAEDRTTRALAVQFRYLQKTPDRQWLARRARARLTGAQRRQRGRLAAMEATIADELADLHHRLARLCELSDAEWHARTARIERRVDAVAADVNARRLDRFHERMAAETEPSGLSLTTLIAGLFAPPEPLPPPPVVLAEQLAYHVIVGEVPPAVIAEIENNAANYPGVKIVDHTARHYPGGTSSAHLVGYVGSRTNPTDDVDAQAVRESTIDTAVGLTGVERLRESTLRGRAGEVIEQTDHRGKVLTRFQKRASVAGADVVLTIDARLQSAAEALIDRQLRRLERGAGAPRSDDRASGGQHADDRGGAIIVLDVFSGEVLAAASAPRFDPNWFAGGDPRAAAMLDDVRRPLFDRVAQMAIPPGSVFKSLTALALVQSSAVDPNEVFRCQGYLDEPDRMRCRIFRHHGVGHGDVTLADALAQSCNVYFFHHATRLGAARLLAWSERLGFGRATGIDWPAESPGRLPALAELKANSATQMLAVGQGAIAVTPLQVARLYAAIANGGNLIAPRLTRDSVDSPSAINAKSPPSMLSEATRIAGLTPATIAAVSAGLCRAVEDPNGTAYANVRLASVRVAGKTGTAETGDRGADHSWFAGYVPADAPRYALVVVFEHAGDGATVAGSAARGLIERMLQLGYLAAPPATARVIPPGKG